jgi:type I restriction enzyme, S subunit
VNPSSAKLGQFLRQRSAPVIIDETQIYKRLRVQLHGRGIVLRDQVSGGDIRTKKQQVVRVGDFLVAEIDAKVGGFGIVPYDVDGGIVSSHYFLFEIDESMCLKGWLDASIRSGRLEEQVTARGSTNYAAIRPSQILDFEIPLPSLAEQRRIVDRLSHFSSRAQEISELHRETGVAFSSLPTLMAHRPDLTTTEKESRGWIEKPLADLVTESRYFRVVDGLKSYPNLGIYSFGRGLFRKSPIEGARTSARELNRVRAGQFIYSRLFAFEGAFGMVEPEFDGYFVSNEYPTFDCNPDLVLPEFLRAYFGLPAIWRELSAGSKGLGDRRQRVQPASLIAHRLLVPPLNEQEQLLRVAPLARAARDLVTAASSQVEALFKSVIHHSLGADSAVPAPAG